MKHIKKHGHSSPSSGKKSGNSEPLVDSMSKDGEAKVTCIMGLVKLLDGKRFYVSRETLVDAKEKLMKRPLNELEELQECIALFAEREDPSIKDGVCTSFITSYVDNLGKNLDWKPFVQELMQCDGVDITSTFLFGDKMPKEKPKAD